MYSYTFTYDKTKQCRILADTEEQARDMLNSAWVNGEKIVTTNDVVLTHKEEATWATK